jgi:hypothetical protein
VVLAAPQQQYKPSCRLDEHHQEKQLPFETTGKTTPRTSQFFHSTTNISETIIKHYGVHLKLKIKPGGEEQRTSSKSRR